MTLKNADRLCLYDRVAALRADGNALAGPFAGPSPSLHRFERRWTVVLPAAAADGVVALSAPEGGGGPPRSGPDDRDVVSKATLWIQEASDLRRAVKPDTIFPSCVDPGDGVTDMSLADEFDSAFRVLDDNELPGYLPPGGASLSPGDFLVYNAFPFLLHAPIELDATASSSDHGMEAVGGVGSDESVASTGMEDESADGATASPSSLAVSTHTARSSRRLAALLLASSHRCSDAHNRLRLLASHFDIPSTDFDASASILAITFEAAVQQYRLTDYDALFRASESIASLLVLPSWPDDDARRWRHLGQDDHPDSDDEAKRRSGGVRASSPATSDLNGRQQQRQASAKGTPPAVLSQLQAAFVLLDAVREAWRCRRLSSVSPANPCGVPAARVAVARTYRLDGYLVPFGRANMLPQGRKSDVVGSLRSSDGHSPLAFPAALSSAVSARVSTLSLDCKVLGLRRHAVPAADLPGLICELMRNLLIGTVNRSGSATSSAILSSSSGGPHQPIAARASDAAPYRPFTLIDLFTRPHDVLSLYLLPAIHVAFRRAAEAAHSFGRRSTAGGVGTTTTTTAATSTAVQSLSEAPMDVAAVLLEVRRQVRRLTTDRTSSAVASARSSATGMHATPMESFASGGIVDPVRRASVSGAAWLERLDSFLLDDGGCSTGDTARATGLVPSLVEEGSGGVLALLERLHRTAIDPPADTGKSTSTALPHAGQRRRALPFPAIEPQWAADMLCMLGKLLTGHHAFGRPAGAAAGRLSGGTAAAAALVQAMAASGTRIFVHPRDTQYFLAVLTSCLPHVWIACRASHSGARLDSLYVTSDMSVADEEDSRQGSRDDDGGAAARHGPPSPPSSETFDEKPHHNRSPNRQGGAGAHARSSVRAGVHMPPTLFTCWLCAMYADGTHRPLCRAVDFACSPYQAPAGAVAAVATILAPPSMKMGDLTYQGGVAFSELPPPPPPLDPRVLNQMLVAFAERCRRKAASAVKAASTAPVLASPSFPSFRLSPADDVQLRRLLMHHPKNRYIVGCGISHFEIMHMVPLAPTTTTSPAAPGAAGVASGDGSVATGSSTLLASRDMPKFLAVHPCGRRDFFDYEDCFAADRRQQHSHMPTTSSSSGSTLPSAAGVVQLTVKPFYLRRVSSTALPLPELLLPYGMSRVHFGTMRAMLAYYGNCLREQVQQDWARLQATLKAERDDALESGRWKVNGAPVVKEETPSLLSGMVFDEEGAHRATDQLDWSGVDGSSWLATAVSEPRPLADSRGDLPPTASQVSTAVNRLADEAARMMLHPPDLAAAMHALRCHPAYYDLRGCGVSYVQVGFIQRHARQKPLTLREAAVLLVRTPPPRGHDDSDDSSDDLRRGPRGDGATVPSLSPSSSSRTAAGGIGGGLLVPCFFIKRHCGSLCSFSLRRCYESKYAASPWAVWTSSSSRTTGTPCAPSMEAGGPLADGTMENADGELDLDPLALPGWLAEPPSREPTAHGENADIDDDPVDAVGDLRKPVRLMGQVTRPLGRAASGPPTHDDMISQTATHGNDQIGRRRRRDDDDDVLRSATSQLPTPRRSDRSGPAVYSEPIFHGESTDPATAVPAMTRDEPRDVGHHRKRHLALSSLARLPPAPPPSNFVRLPADDGCDPDVDEYNV